MGRWTCVVQAELHPRYRPEPCELQLLEERVHLLLQPLALEVARPQQRPRCVAPALAVACQLPPEVRRLDAQLLPRLARAHLAWHSHRRLEEHLARLQVRSARRLRCVAESRVAQEFLQPRRQ